VTVLDNVESYKCVKQCMINEMDRNRATDKN